MYAHVHDGTQLGNNQLYPTFSEIVNHVIVENSTKNVVNKNKAVCVSIVHRSDGICCPHNCRTTQI